MYLRGANWQAATLIVVLFAPLTSATHPLPDAVTFDRASDLVLSGVDFTLDGTILWSNKYVQDNPESSKISLEIWDGDELVFDGNLGILDENDDLITKMSLGPLSLTGIGSHALSLYLSHGQGDDLHEVLGKKDVQVIPGLVSLLPLLCVIFIAFAFHQVLLSLWVGLFVAATIIAGGNAFRGFLAVLDDYLVRALFDLDHVKILIFTWFNAGLVHILVRAGGAHGLSRLLGKIVKNRWTAQWMTYAVGCFIFFDDYSSCLIVGNNMRMVADSVMLSHEKLAFLVHATASGPAAIAPISAWIGYEVALIRQNLPPSMAHWDGFEVFLATVPSRLFPLYMLIFIPFLIMFKRDFGPMLYAERRALRQGKLVDDEDAKYLLPETTQGNAKEGIPLRWWNAVIPLAVLIGIDVGAMLVTGYIECVRKHEEEGAELDTSIGNLTANGDSFNALIYGGFAASVVCFIMYTLQGIMTLTECLASWICGIQEFAETLIVLMFAWAIGEALVDLKVANLVTSTIGPILSSHALGTLIFVFSCFISFSTGTSWGTMAIVFPLALPLADSVSGGDESSVLLAVSAILTGSLFGDMCTPISDSGILSATSSQVSITRHVETMLPYAIICAALAAIMYLPPGMGIWPGYISTLIGIPILGVAVYVLGTRIDSEERSKFWFVEKHFKKYAEINNKELESTKAALLDCA